METIKEIGKDIFEIVRKVKNKFSIPRRTTRTFKGRKEQVAILIGSPEHGNLGDHAISLAEVAFLKEYYPNLQVIEISGAHFRADADGIIKRVKDNDIIFVTGGGFIGNLWMEEEEMVRKVIKVFPNNPIIIFPQTIYFDNSNIGKNEKEISKACYENHQNLCICLREKKSYELITSEFSKVSKCLFIPDIVTYLNMTQPLLQRSGALLCMRTDKEQVLSQEHLQKIKGLLGLNNLQCTYTSTVLNYNFNLSQRQSEFEKKINEFKRSRVVITDRLHGMLFAAISGTPCIALNNISGKVEGVYEWIKDLGYVKYARDWSEIEKYLEEILKQDSSSYDNRKLKPYFEQMAKEIERYLQKNEL